MEIGESGPLAARSWASLPALDPTNSLVWLPADDIWPDRPGSER